MDEFVPFFKLPYRSIDPRVQERLLGNTRSVGMVVLAAALCPEMLSEQEKWTAPKSLARAERMGEQCSRTPQQIRATLLEWLLTPVPGVPKTFGGRMGQLGVWDPSVATWIILRMCHEILRDVKPDYREPFEHALADLEVAIKPGQERARPNPAERAARVADDYATSGDFAQSILENANTRGPDRFHWWAMFALRDTIWEIANALQSKERISRQKSFDAAATTAWSRLSHIAYMRDKKQESSLVLAQLLERALYTYPFGYSADKAKGSSSGALSAGASFGWAVAGAVAGAVVVRALR